METSTKYSHRLVNQPHSHSQYMRRAEAYMASEGACQVPASQRESDRIGRVIELQARMTMTCCNPWALGNIHCVKTLPAQKMRRSI